MAFDYFVNRKVDIAVIEVGLGGRLDSTNVITPLVSLITNISLDHKDILGDTLEKIAFEKAGIIKEGVPAVVSEMQPETYKVFIEKAKQTHSKIIFAEKAITAKIDGDLLTVTGGELFQVPEFPLRGSYQAKNISGVLKTIELLPFMVKRHDIINGLRNVVKNTGPQRSLAKDRRKSAHHLRYGSQRSRHCRGAEANQQRNIRETFYRDWNGEGQRRFRRAQTTSHNCRLLLLPGENTQGDASR